MKISIITLFPKMIDGFFKESIVKRAMEKKLVERVEPIYKALSKIFNFQFSIFNKKIKNPKSKILLTSAKGKQFNQKKAQEYSKFDQLIIIAGHYEGVDERVLDFIDEEVSMGDFILTGGEIPAAAIVDSVVRLIPGVLKKEQATLQETFSIKGENLLEYPQYTRPEIFNKLKVPKVLTGGNHQEIEKWRLEMAKKETKKKRPDLLDILKKKD